MKETILYIYGYGSNPTNSSTMKVMKQIVEEMGFDLVSIEYNQENPDVGIDLIEKYIRDNNIKYVIGHSLGGFITICLNSNVKKLVINPCMKPSFELPKLGNFSVDTLYNYEYLEGWLKSGNDTPWVNQTEDVIGLFGDKDEMFDYYEMFKKQYPRACRIKSTHRPTLASFDENIKTKMREFFK